MSDNVAPAKVSSSRKNTSHAAESGDNSSTNQNTTDNSTVNDGQQNPPAPPMAFQGPPPLEELASHATRIHRDWNPKYGRVQKCDWCNGRSVGTLQVCSACSLRMCEDCARQRKWHTNRSHFIDADACDWSLKKAANNRGSKRPAPAASSAEPSTPAPRRRKLNMATESRQDDDDDDASIDDAASFLNSGPGRRRFPAPANVRHQPDEALPNPSAARDVHRQESLPHRQAPHNPAQHGTLEPTTAAPRARPSVRQAAARVMLSLNGTARHSSRGRFGDDGDGYDEEHEDEEQDGEGDVYKKKGHAEQVNDPLLRRGNQREQGTAGRPLSHVRTGREHTSSPLVGEDLSRQPLAHRPAPTAADIEHDRIILNIYDWVYGNRPNLDPRRARTQIPDHWAGNWQTMAPQYGREGSPSVYNSYPAPQYPAPGYGQFPSHAPAPPGYPPHGYHEYQGYAHYQCYGAGGPCPPRARSNPAYHPYNEHNQAEMEHARQDSTTLDEMINAWTYHPLLLRLMNHENRRVYAIGLLWDVLEVRRTRVFIRDDSQTVRWFINERDRQFRIQHSAAYNSQHGQYQFRAPTPVLIKGHTPFAQFPTPAPQGQWDEVTGHGNHAIDACRAESAGEDDARSENRSVVMVEEGEEVVEE
ncbi:hypothetical protein N657DRAFT_676057 [Parathielavia appendiculata]|uniref:Uncharacterized protein n=1 Tax=Parathielavia appendiculata TaxID=2587402 RepID=A0AAN6Z882_9PEZI|nr:hypothetical protein N657DRAFT_676057 [Parathielavia appendiculata]